MTKKILRVARAGKRFSGGTFVNTTLLQLIFHLISMYRKIFFSGRALTTVVKCLGKFYTRFGHIEPARARKEAGEKMASYHRAKRHTAREVVEEEEEEKNTQECYSDVSIIAPAANIVLEGIQCG